MSINLKSIALIYAYFLKSLKSKVYYLINASSTIQVYSTKRFNIGTMCGIEEMYKLPLVRFVIAGVGLFLLSTHHYMSLYEAHYSADNL